MRRIQFYHLVCITLSSALNMGRNAWHAAFLVSGSLSGLRSALPILPRMSLTLPQRVTK